MAFRDKYQTPEKVIASYDYVDIADGTGNRNFYLCVTEDSAAVDYILTTQTLYSTDIEGYHLVANTDGFGTAKADLDFDLTAFNSPRTIKGTALVQLGLTNFAETNATGDTVWSKYIVTLYKYDGTTETQIGTATSPTKRTFASGDNIYEYFIQTFPITLTETRLKRGDILRCNLKVYASGAGTGNAGGIYYGHDPMNRDGSGITPSSQDTITKSQITVPFKINI